MKQLLKTGLVLTIGLAQPALAHDTWLLPSQGAVRTGTVMTLDLTSGMNFPMLDTAIDPERVERMVCRLAGTKVEITRRDKGANSLHASTRLEAPGIATVWVDLEPKSIELKPGEVEEYLDEIQPLEAIRKAWATIPEPRVWKEIYTKHAKTYVRVGEVTADTSWSEPTGAPLEFIPGKDPTALREGDEVSVQLLRHGAPVPRFSVGIVSEGAQSATIRTTDERGWISFTLDRAGWYLIRGTDLRSPSGGRTEWESDFVTLTLHVAKK